MAERHWHLGCWKHLIAAAAVPQLSALAVVRYAHVLPWKSSFETYSKSKRCLGQLLVMEWPAQKCDRGDID